MFLPGEFIFINLFQILRKQEKYRTISQYIFNLYVDKNKL